MPSKDSLTIYSTDYISITSKRLSVILTAILVLALTILAMGAFSGCAENAPSKAAQVDKVIITSVNAGLPLIIAKINAGKLTQKQCDTFTKLYKEYYDAQMVAKAAIEKAIFAAPGTSPADVATANAAVSVAEQALLSFINSVI